MSALKTVYESNLLAPRLACQQAVADNPEQALTGKIISAAVEVHRALGPGLLESVYQVCLCHELGIREISFRQQVEIPVSYKGVKLDCGYRIDLIASDKVVVELKSVQQILPVHEA